MPRRLRRPSTVEKSSRYSTMQANLCDLIQCRRRHTSWWPSQYRLSTIDRADWRTNLFNRLNIMQLKDIIFTTSSITPPTITFHTSLFLKSLGILEHSPSSSLNLQSAILQFQVSFQALRVHFTNCEPVQYSPCWHPRAGYGLPAAGSVHLRFSEEPTRPLPLPIAFRVIMPWSAKRFPRHFGLPSPAKLPYSILNDGKHLQKCTLVHSINIIH